ncbi:hypothetical protein HDV05_000424, partial [Chytridiales sp. JEL 0842]
SLPSVLYTVIPKAFKDELYGGKDIDFCSKFAWEIATEKFAREAKETEHMFWSMFSNTSIARTLAGHMFEAHCHRLFMDRGHSSKQPYAVRWVTEDSRRYLEGQFVIKDDESNSKSSIEIKGKQGATELNFQKMLDMLLDETIEVTKLRAVSFEMVCYVKSSQMYEVSPQQICFMYQKPLSKTQQSFDAIMYRGALFQMTLAREHPFNLKHVNGVMKAMECNAFVYLVNSKAEELMGQKNFGFQKPLNANKKQTNMVLPRRLASQFVVTIPADVNKLFGKESGESQTSTS